jgi:hypothetical protein
MYAHPGMPGSISAIAGRLKEKKRSGRISGRLS